MLLLLRKLLDYVPDVIKTKWQMRSIGTFNPFLFINPNYEYSILFNQPMLWKNSFTKRISVLYVRLGLNLH